jgi:hypothetical protein
MSMTAGSTKRLRKAINQIDWRFIVGGASVRALPYVLGATKQADAAAPAARLGSF